MLEHYLSLATKAIFVENMALAFFLGMCSFLAISKKVETSVQLGVAVIFVLGVTCPLNQVLYTSFLKEGVLARFGLEGIEKRPRADSLRIATSTISASVSLTSPRAESREYARNCVFVIATAISGRAMSCSAKRATSQSSVSGSTAR